MGKKTYIMDRWTPEREKMLEETRKWCARLHEGIEAVIKATESVVPTPVAVPIAVPVDEAPAKFSNKYDGIVLYPKDFSNK